VSSFTWLDHTDSERRKVLEAIDRLRERETRDELGFASIRNVFADLFFPGTTVMQTRPRYFLFVPWLYQSLAKKRGARSDVASALRREELRMIEQLKAAGEVDGVIGRRSGKRLLRTPSSIYWLGLRDWGLCRFHGIQEDFHRRFEHLTNADAIDHDDDGVALDRSVGVWDPELPAAPANFPETVSLKLLKHEAAYLREALIQRCQDSVLAVFVRKAEPADVAHVWEHPASRELPPELADAVQHSRVFALVGLGATTLYALMLNEKLPQSDERDARIESLRGHFRAWCEEATSDASLGTWNRSAFWSLVTSRAPIHDRTRRFVERWLELSMWTRGAAGLDAADARTTITERERQLKGARARLQNMRALDLWNPTDHSARLDYRWPTANRHLTEIYQAENHAGAQ
jgi:hypothetical protein